MKIAKNILILILISIGLPSILLSNADIDKVDKEESELLSVISNEGDRGKERVELNIEKSKNSKSIENNSSDKPKKEKIKLADVAKEKEEKAKEDKKREEEAKREAQKREKKLQELEQKRPKRKLTLDEKRAILAIKKKKEQDAAEAKAEALYQKALQEAIESVR